MKEYIDAIKKYAVFSGRVSRREYWMFFLFNLLINIILLFVGYVTFGEKGMKLFSNIYGLVILSPALAVTIRRLHDIGKSGWWVLISLIPLFGGIILLVMLMRDSQAGDNKYGANPKGINSNPGSVIN